MNNYTQITRDERVIIADLWKRRKTYYYLTPHEVFVLGMKPENFQVQGLI